MPQQPAPSRMSDQDLLDVFRAVQSGTEDETLFDALSSEESNRLDRLTAEQTEPGAAPVSSAVGRFAGQYGRGIRDMALGLLEMITKPPGVNLESAVALGEAGRGQFVKMGEALKRGAEGARRGQSPVLSAIEAAGRLAAGVVPGIGPAAAELGEQAGEGDIAGAAGGAAALLTPFALGPAGRIRAAKPVGEVPLTRGQRTGSPASVFAEELISKSIGGKRIFQVQRAAQQEALIAKAHRAVEKVSPAKAVPSKLGRTIAQDLEASKAARQAQASAIFEDMDKATGWKNVVDLEPVKRVAQEQLAELGGPELVLGKTPYAGLRAQLEFIANEAPDTTTFSIANKTRSDMLAAMRKFDEPVPGKSAHVYGVLENAMREAVEQGAKEAKVYTQWVRARKLWRELKQTYNQGLVEKTLAEKVPAEKVAAQLTRAPLKEVATLKGAVSRPTFQAAKARVIRDIFDRDIRGEAAGGALPPEVTAPAPGKAFRGEKAGTAIEQLGEERFHTLFSKPERAAILDTVRLAQHISRQTGTSVGGLIAGNLNKVVMWTGPVAGTALIAVGEPAAGIGVALSPIAAQLGMNIAARIMTRPEGLTAWRGLFRAIGNRNAAQAAAAAQALRKAMTDEEIAEIQQAQNKQK